MEPFISPDGNTLFFNSLNDGEDTKLFYASRINDSTFTFVGEVIGANQLAPPQLDAVPDLDEEGNFYWTSTRDYPTELENLFRGTYENGAVTEIARVHGDFNRSTPGWLVMDHGISLDGQTIYYNNARFDQDNCTGPCETEIGIASKVDATTFTKSLESDDILQNIINPDYIYYAPCITSDDLELYYTRYLAGDISPTTEFEICVAVRDMPEDVFSLPVVLFSASIANIVEAPSLTVNKEILYYHQKIANTHKIFMSYRDTDVSIPSRVDQLAIQIFPNPTIGTIFIKTKMNYQHMEVFIYTPTGRFISKVVDTNQIDMSDLSNGNYVLKIEIDGQNATKLVTKE